ncbi:MAG: hypothetical protein GXX78_02600 [Bacteroidales bacterium]|nr:hypothetical protein [Bacteroidales bacterium]
MTGYIGCEIRSNIIDQKIVWYGSINLLSFGTAEESMMRLVSANIAYELVKSSPF